METCLPGKCDACPCAFNPVGKSEISCGFLALPTTFVKFLKTFPAHLELLAHARWESQRALIHIRIPISAWDCVLTGCRFSKRRKTKIIRVFTVIHKLKACEKKVNKSFGPGSNCGSLQIITFNWKWNLRHNLQAINRSNICTAVRWQNVFHSELELFYLIFYCLSANNHSQFAALPGRWIIKSTLNPIYLDLISH